MALTEKNISELAAAVGSWLQYEQLCKRDYLLNESSLFIPLSMYVNAHERLGIVPEHDHPKFKNSSKGRNKQIDFVMLTRDQQRIKAALETKFVKVEWVLDPKTGTEKLKGRIYTGEIIRDILRLKLLKEKQQIHRCLVVVGKFEDIRIRVMEITSKGTFPHHGNRVFPHVLSFTDPGSSKSVDLTDNTTPFFKHFESAASELKIPLPKKVRTKLVGIYPRNPSDNEYCCFIWMIKSVSPGKKNRQNRKSKATCVATKGTKMKDKKPRSKSSEKPNAS